MDGYKFLIIDDDRGDLKLMRRHLIELYPGSTIFEAESGNAANKYHEEPVEVIFVDYLLPGISGIDLLSGLCRTWPRAAVFMMTGQGDEDVAKSAILRGAADYIPKSAITPAALQRMVTNGLQMARMHWQIQEHQRELQQFSDVLVHDLRAPIRAIKFLSEQIIEDFEAGDMAEVTREFELMTRSVTKMSQLIERLATHINPHSDGAPEHVAVASLVEDACLALSRDIADSEARIETQFESESAYCFPPDITQLLQNLIGNAIKYRSDAPPHIRIMTRGTARGIQFSVSDNGIGVPEGYRERIFEPFKRLQRSMDLPGTGLGLATCAKIAKRHDGRIWCENGPEEPEGASGTTIHFTLGLKPHAHSEPGPQAETAEDRLATGP